MGGDEAALQVCGRGAVQGVPAQSEALFRRSVLPGVQGYCEVGGRAGAQLH